MRIGLDKRADWLSRLRTIKFSGDPKIQRLCFMMTRDAVGALLKNIRPPIISRVEFGRLTAIVEVVYLDNIPHIFVRSGIYLFLAPKPSEKTAP